VESSGGALVIGAGEMVLVIAGLVAIWLVLVGLGFLGLRMDRLAGPRRILIVPGMIVMSLVVGFLLLIAVILLGILANA
jgi:hypothetical protein